MSSQTFLETKSTMVRPLSEAPIRSRSVRRLGYDENEAVAVDRWENEGGKWIDRLTSRNHSASRKPHSASNRVDHGNGNLGRIVYVILTKPQDSTSFFALELGEKRVGICVFNRKVHAMQFEKNTQGLSTGAVTPIAAEALADALEAKKAQGATDVIIDPSASSGRSKATDIDEYISSIKL